MTLLSVAKLHQNGRAKVSKFSSRQKLLAIRQSEQANDSASIVIRAIERFCNNEVQEKPQQEAK